MKMRNEEYQKGDKVLFYRSFTIDPQKILGIAIIQGRARPSDGLADFDVIFRGERRLFNMEKTKDFDGCRNLGILDLEIT